MTQKQIIVVLLSVVIIASVFYYIYDNYYTSQTDPSKAGPQEYLKYLEQSSKDFNFPQVKNSETIHGSDLPPNLQAFLPLDTSKTEISVDTTKFAISKVSFVDGTAGYQISFLRQDNQAVVNKYLKDLTDERGFTFIRTTDFVIHAVIDQDKKIILTARST